MKLALLLILLLLGWLAWQAGRGGPLPGTGTSAPDFALVDQQGRMHRLSDYRGRWLVLYFYPKDGTPGCTREACAFRDGLARLQATGAAVVGISVDTQASHARFAEKHRLNFPLLADSGGAVARRYGTLMDWKLYRMARRNTFLIDPQGKIRRAYTRVDPTRHAGELLAELERATQ
jgi:peroxiredoxin Q/BCP